MVGYSGKQSSLEGPRQTGEMSWHCVKGRVTQMRPNNSIQQCRIRDNWLEDSFAEKYPGALVDSEVNTWGERETLLICMAGEDRSRLFLQFSCDRTMGKRLKLPYETFRLCMRNAFSPTGPGCTERMWNLHPWKHWKSDWTGASTAGSGGTCLLQVFGLDNFQALLPISIILWFRCFFSAFVWKKENAASHS